LETRDTADWKSALRPNPVLSSIPHAGCKTRRREERYGGQAGWEISLSAFIRVISGKIPWVHGKANPWKLIVFPARFSLPKHLQKIFFKNIFCPQFFFKIA
jgi:hypothetical protein